MRVISTEEKVKVIIEIAETTRNTHMSHRHRNDWMSATQRILERYMDELSSEVFERAEIWSLYNGFFLTAYELFIWNSDKETHSNVKTRMRIVERMGELVLQSVDTIKELNDLPF